MARLSRIALPDAATDGGAQLAGPLVVAQRSGRQPNRRRLAGLFLHFADLLAKQNHRNAATHRTGRRDSIESAGPPFPSCSSDNPTTSHRRRGIERIDWYESRVEVTMREVTPN